MILTKISQLTGVTHHMDIGITCDTYNKGMKKMQEMIPVQIAFPQLDADKREFIMTGITPEEWEIVYDEDD